MNIATALNFQLPGLEASQAPKWVLLIPANSFTGRDKRTWHNKTPEQVITETQRVGLDLPFDIEHATEIKGPIGEYAGAIAWIPVSTLEVRNGDIWGQVQWNEHGSALVKDRAYRYYSPAFHFDRAGNVLRLVSVALTNRSNLPELPALNRESKTMDKILIALGLAAGATEDDAVTSIQGIKNEQQLALNRANTPDPNKFIPTETHQLALNRAETAETKLAEQEQAKFETEAQSAVDAGIKAKKIAPANRDHFLAMCRAEGGLENFNDYIAKAPGVMAAEPKPKDPEQTGGSKLNEGELATCRLLDISEADFISTRDAG